LKQVAARRTFVDFTDRISDELSNFIIGRRSGSFTDKIADEINVVSTDKYMGPERIYKAPEKPATEKINMQQISSLKGRLISLAWRNRDTIKKIPLLNSLSRRLYYSRLKDY
jgi:hypothetical protein